MTERIWFNGEILPINQAKVSVEDRGFQFADGVYEVIRVYAGKPFTINEHLDRLGRSAKAIFITIPLDLKTLVGEIEKLIATNKVMEGMVYLQLTRGAAPRNHIYTEPMQPTLLFYTRPLPPVPEPGTAPGVKLLAVPDDRWQKCYIKSISLLPNVLAKNQAAGAGADEAVFIDTGGIVTECSASNIHMIHKGKLHTHPVGPKVLPGVTRDQLLICAREAGVPVIETPFTEKEALAADELFITSTTREISWVKQWNDRTVAEACGLITLRLHQALREKVRQATTPANRRPARIPLGSGCR